MASRLSPRYEAKRQAGSCTNLLQKGHQKANGTWISDARTNVLLILQEKNPYLSLVLPERVTSVISQGVCAIVAKAILPTCPRVEV